VASVFFLIKIKNRKNDVCSDGSTRIVNVGLIGISYSMSWRKTFFYNYCF